MIELLTVVTLLLSFASFVLLTCARRPATAPTATKSMKSAGKSCKTAIGDPVEVTARGGTPPATPPNKGNLKDPPKPPIKQISGGPKEPAPAAPPPPGSGDSPKPNGSKDAKSGSVVPGQDGVDNDGKPKVEKTVMLTLRQRKGDKSKEQDDVEETGGEAIDVAKPSDKDPKKDLKSGKNAKSTVNGGKPGAVTPLKSSDNTDAKKKKDDSKPVIPPGMSNKDDPTQKVGSKEEAAGQSKADGGVSNVSAAKKDGEAPPDGTAAKKPEKESKSKESKSKEEKVSEKKDDKSKADKDKDKDKDKDTKDKTSKENKKEEKSKTKTEGA